MRGNVEGEGAVRPMRGELPLSPFMQAKIGQLSLLKVATPKPAPVEPRIVEASLAQQTSQPA